MTGNKPLRTTKRRSCTTRAKHRATNNKRNANNGIGDPHTCQTLSSMFIRGPLGAQMSPRMKHTHFNLHTANTHHRTVPPQFCLKQMTQRTPTDVNKTRCSLTALRISPLSSLPNLAGKYQSMTSSHTGHMKLVPAARLPPTSRGTSVALGPPNHSTPNRKASHHAKASQPKNV